MGLFTHLDRICRPNEDKLLKLRGLGYDTLGKEYLLEVDEMELVRKVLHAGADEVGGNAGNAAFFLGHLGLECDLAAPSRFPALTTLFEGLPVYVWGIRRKLLATSAKPRDPEIVHWIVEVKPPLVEEAGRMIFTHDPMTREGWLDGGFFNNLRGGVLFLSGLHLVQRTDRLKEVADMVEDRRDKHDLKVYLEACEVSSGSQMKLAFELFTRRQLVDAVGMNEREAVLLGTRSQFPGPIVDVIRDFHDRRGMDVTVHSAKWACSTRPEGLRNVIDLVEAWAMNDLSLYKTMDSRPVWPDAGPAIPTRKLPELLRLTGLGDAFAITDAMRLLAPERFREALEKVVALPTKQVY